jgi:hypothetical protein
VGFDFFGIAVDPAPDDPGAPAATVSAVLGADPVPGPMSTLARMTDPAGGVVACAPVRGRLLFLDLAVDEGTAEVIKARWPGRDVHLLAVRAAVDACSYRWWRAGGTLARAVDVEGSTDGVERDEGERLPEEAEVWAAAGSTGVPSGGRLGEALSARLLGARLDELPGQVRETVVPTWTAARATPVGSASAPPPRRTVPTGGRADESSARTTPSRSALLVMLGLAAVLLLAIVVVLLAVS